MPPIYVKETASIIGSTPKAKKQSEIWAQEKNDNFMFTGDANLRHVPKYFVRIFNVSDMEQRIERPWVMPGKGGKMIVVPAKEDGQRYSRPFLIPDIVQMPTDRAGGWEMGTRGIDGKFLAQDAINPEDPSGNWKTVRTRLESSLSNEGTNLYHFGLFWDSTPGTDTSVPPSEDALRVAVERLEANYNRLIDEAQLMSINPKMMDQVGHLHRRAANYFGRSFTWNIRYEKQNQCPNCGTALPMTASRCFTQGCRRVIDWTRALEEGTATVEEAIAAGVLEAQAENMGKTRKRAKA
jgi:hypothetical protein